MAFIIGLNQECFSYAPAAVNDQEFEFIRVEEQVQVLEFSFPADDG
jgi:hypothetical protein